MEMIHMKILYKAQAISSGGRKGKVIIKDSPFEFQMVPPVELGEPAKREPIRNNYSRRVTRLVLKVPFYTWPGIANLI